MLCKEANVDARHWLEEVRDQLADRKLPPFYVERLVEELSDHLTDFMEDPMSTDAKDLRGLTRHLGVPAELAATAASEFRKQRFSRRHPVMIFVVMPIATLALMWATTIFIFVLAAGALSWLNGGTGERFPEWLVASMPVAACGIVLVPIALTAALFCRVARRAAVGWKWPLGACLVLAIIGGAAIFDMKISPIERGLIHGTQFRNVNPPSPPSNGSLMFGFGLNKYPRPWQIVQFSVPLTICGCFIWRQASLRRQHVLAN
jgi:hypothetical protein